MRRAIDIQTLRTDPRRALLAVFFVYLAAGILLYGNSLSGEFLWDDIYLVRSNADIRSLSFFGKLWVQDIAAGAGRFYGFYRPLQMASYMVDHFFWGLYPPGYHLTNVLLHAGVAVLLFQLLRMMGRNFFTSFVAGLFFLSHPVQTEAVAYISGRAEILAAAGVLAALIFYIAHLYSSRPACFFGALFFYLFALFSKEYGAVFLLLVLLYHIVFRQRGWWPRIVPFALITLLFSLWRFAVLDYAPAPQNFFQSGQSVLNGLGAVTRYTGMLVWPFGLHMGYAKVDLFPLHYSVILGGVFAAFAFFLIVSRRHDPFISFSVSWFLVALLPLLNIFYPLYAYMSQHWLYLPGMGFFFLLSYGGDRLYRRSKRIGLVLVVCLLVFFGVRTIQQNRYWRDPIVFYERSLSWEPDNTGFLVNLGIEYNNRGLREKSAVLFDRALSLCLERARVFNDQAVGLMAAGRVDEGVVLFRKAIAGLLDNEYLLQSLGRLGDPTLAVKAVELTRRRARMFYNLGFALWEAGDPSRAIKALRRALEVEPAFQEARALLDQFEKGVVAISQQSLGGSDGRGLSLLQKADF